MAPRKLDPKVVAWPFSRLGELLDALAVRSGYSSQSGRLPQPPDGLRLQDDSAIGAWMDSACGYLGLEAEPVSAQYSEIEQLIRSGGPVILRLPVSLVDDPPAFIALLNGRSGVARILGPDLHVRRVGIDALQQLICAPYDAPLGGLVDDLLAEAGIPDTGRPRARRLILQDQLGSVRIESGWLLRLPPSVGLHQSFRHEKIYRPVWILLAMYALQQVLAVASWYIIGRGIFQGHFDLGWMLAWGVLLLSAIPVQMIVSDAQSELSMGAGALFKQRLIHGVLKLDPEEIRHQGMGGFLNRVMESEAVELLAMGGGLVALLSFVELGLALVILSRGAGGPLSAAALSVWTILTLALLYRYYRTSREWTETYREMTNHLVEEMVGHRTRLVQEDPLRRHSTEDQELDSYMQISERMDRQGMQLNALVSRGWILVGLGSIAPAFIAGRPEAQNLAIGLGGVLLASQGLGKLVSGAQSLSGLFNAWTQVSPLFKAAARPRALPALGFVPPPPGGPASSSAATEMLSGDSQALLQARDLVFRYRPNGRPALQGCSLQINPGDRLLLEGPSGGGKSTLGAVLTGLRIPESGSMLLWGFDRQLLGTEEWRKRVVMAPQFQENHVFSETFAFNLLMGRRWPPEPEDLAEAEAICRELGLGELLQRMPSGFQQMLGESGWQLSHGERSRLFIARALLQKSDLIVLDESFGALDPENLERALSCVISRAPTLLVIAHP